MYIYSYFYLFYCRCRYHVTAVDMDFGENYIKTQKNNEKENQTKRTIRLCVIQNKQWRLNGLEKGKRSTIHK